ncbi:MAG: LysM peptidoglycan-binding domain-containing protein [Bdellovibrionales bacterium]|nr:LysM peptidoglycan-binding domain-containing protein [Bdellovibrionales bacterium]
MLLGLTLGAGAASGEGLPSALAPDYSHYPEAPPDRSITVSGVVIEPTVPDLPLDRRLTTEKTYVTRKGDTLRKLAHLLYGHRTWWTRVKGENKQFLSYRPDDQLPPGRPIAYRAARLGDEYLVRENDWLIRIAQWKYGDTGFWKQLYDKNRSTIDDPDLIHPGDRLRFGPDGTIRMAKTGKVIVKGLSRAERAKPAAAAPAVPEPPAPVVASRPAVVRPPVFEGVLPTEVERAPGSEGSDGMLGSGQWPVWLAVIVGLLVLLGALLWRAQEVTSGEPIRPLGAHDPGSAPSKPLERPRAPYDTMALDETFMDDRNLDYIDVPRRPSYHTITAGWFRKQLKKWMKDDAN